MAKNLVNGTNVVIEENGDNINMNLSSAYNTNLQQEINDSFKENNIYSTTETVVGTWIDGKPIYRKVIRKDTATSAGANPTISTGVAFSLIGEITELKVLGKQSNSSTWFIASSNLLNQEVFGCYLSENNIAIRNYWALEKIICILEYTKASS